MAALWQGLAETGQIERLVGHGPQVFRCRVPPDRLAALIAAGCQSGAWACLIDQATDDAAAMAAALPPPAVTPQ